ncbi:hypothetical protein B0H14DRAFT_2631410 [Mycena olivaceomarginata]|nr:hypothetical protein B0H14DRAFT_2631410 [Mycena olivaceomarginata]
MKGRPCPPLYPRGWNTVESALSGRNVWIKTAAPATGSEQGQKNTGKGKKGKKVKPEKVFTPVHKIRSSMVNILCSELQRQKSWATYSHTIERQTRPPGSTQVKFELE